MLVFTRVAVQNGSDLTRGSNQPYMVIQIPQEGTLFDGWLGD